MNMNMKYFQSTSYSSLCSPIEFCFLWELYDLLSAELAYSLLDAIHFVPTRSLGLAAAPGSGSADIDECCRNDKRSVFSPI